MALALYRKYRPKDFTELSGQKTTRSILMEALKRGQLSHAYLFSGPRGTGKTSTARLIAKSLQCETPSEDGFACGKCEVCEMNQRGQCLDLIEIDAASNRGIDEIRELKEKMLFAPTHAKSKVYIIDEVHMLTKEAFNALLKSLEEPPQHVTFILATTELHKIPATIRSRCQQFDFKRISNADIVARLQYIAKKENIKADPAGLELIAKSADGGMRDAISTLEQLSSEEITEEYVRERLGLEHHEACDQLFAALAKHDTKAGLKIIDELHSRGMQLSDFTTAFLGLLRQKLHDAAGLQNKNLTQKLLTWADLFDQAYVRLKSSSIAQLPLEIALIRATHLEIGGSIESEVSSAAKPSTKNNKVAQAKAPASTSRVEASSHHGAEMIEMDALNAKLEDVLKAISSPGLRGSLKSGSLKEKKGKVLTFVFPSRFHFDIVSSAKSIPEVEAAFKKVYGQELKIHPELAHVSSETPAPQAKAEIDTLGWESTEEAL